ncbi:tetratricopeptide repeat protein [Kitasatospora purpeofusca]|uniref:tetratricopeptide repeat protein n=1 Tax=Kitasatospora purpeofusca TaxID=67352 RepID=UPI0022532512|nr:tetratricopeptide repeat protein [Kitasatospora purpeofusca]MCX4690393.1 tetratricopeptide repeat protein [Kitasatospora purpeofusca]
MAEHRHHWVRAAGRHARAAARATLDLPPVLAVVNADRRLRGPYTAVGSILRATLPDALARCPEAVTGHDIEILSTTPELRDLVPATRETLTSLAVPKERTRFYSALRTLRIAHGLVEFLEAYLRALGTGPHTLVVEDAHRADPTDGEFLAVLLRRIDPALLTVVVTTGTEPLERPAGPGRETLPDALAAHCAVLDPAAAETAASPEPAGQARPEQGRAGLGRAHIAADGIGDDADALAAYLALPADERARLHDLRRAELETAGESSLRLGAIAWHAEHGSDPAGVGADILRHALDHCMDLGYYHAVVDLGERGRRLVTHVSNPNHWWAFTTKMTTSFAALGLAERALPLYDEARALSASPEVHMQAAYATAMLHTRHFEAGRRDHGLARAWVNQAIAFARWHPDPKEREARIVFNRNGLALIEVHQGRPAAALELLDACIARLDESLEPDEHALHRSVLLYNRAQVHAALGHHTEAVADYTAVIECDPNYAEYHFDRGMLWRDLGEPERALADYEHAIRLSPPFPEAYFNRADVLAELGDTEAAAADFGYVLQLDPEFDEARINRASLLLEAGSHDLARADIAAGLERNPKHARLLCLKGQLLAAEEDLAAAAGAYAEAVDVDPESAEAWALFGELRYQEGDLDGAGSHLARAVELSAEPGIRFNLAVVHHDAGRYGEAVRLLDEVVDATEDVDARLQRARCLLGLDRPEAAKADLLACLEADAGAAEQVYGLMPELARG